METQYQDEQDVQRKIMIVDDDKNMYEMYELKFKKEWFDVMVCVNGLDALSKVSEFKPDVILLDVMMPQMDGFETLRAIKELTTTIKSKIIMFSNINTKKDIEKWYELGADEYIVKANCTPKEIVSIVNLVLEK